MQDKDLYKYILGIKEPWDVDRIELNIEEKRVNVWVKHPDRIRWTCPECGAELAIYDHAEERQWRHLDSCAYQTYLHARIPRVSCPKDGVRQVGISWAEEKSRFTMLFERLAIDVLLQCDVSGATRILNISWDEAWHIKERAVARGQAKKRQQAVRHIGVDEKAIAKGHQYMTLVCDIDRGTVEHVSEDRKQESLEQYYQGLSAEQKEAIEAVAIDMWDPYVAATKNHIADAEGKIVYDRFHIMGHLNKAVDKVRKQEHRQLMAEDDDILKGSKYMWLYSKENIPEHSRHEFDILKNEALKVSRAWAIKESLRELWSYIYPATAHKFWKRWYFWATHSRLEPIRAAAEILKRHIANILTYFQHRITNAVSEGLNSKIQTIKKMAYGFRNKDHFKIAIYFHCGGLDLYPC